MKSTEKSVLIKNPSAFPAFFKSVVTDPADNDSVSFSFSPSVQLTLNLNQQSLMFPILIEKAEDFTLEPINCQI